MNRSYLFIALVSLVWTNGAAAQGHDAAAQKFRTQCLSCHQPPDLSFKTDLAWLDQVNRTG